MTILSFIKQEYPFYDAARAIWTFPHDHGCAAVAAPACTAAS